MMMILVAKTPQLLPNISNQMRKKKSKQKEWI